MHVSQHHLEAIANRLHWDHLESQSWYLLKIIMTLLQFSNSDKPIITFNSFIKSSLAEGFAPELAPFLLMIGPDDLHLAQALGHLLLVLLCLSFDALSNHFFRAIWILNRQVFLMLDRINLSFQGAHGIRLLIFGAKHRLHRQAMLWAAHNRRRSARTSSSHGEGIRSTFTVNFLRS